MPTVIKKRRIKALVQILSKEVVEIIDGKQSIVRKKYAMEVMTGDAALMMWHRKKKIEAGCNPDHWQIRTPGAAKITPVIDEHIKLRHKVCPDCKGTKWATHPTTGMAWHPCNRCKGTGEIKVKASA